jgi:hypothetical protein
MHKRRRVASSVIATSLLVGCAGELDSRPLEQEGSDVQIESHEQKLIAVPGWSFMYQAATSRSVRVCVNLRAGVAAARLTTHQNNITPAVQAWVQAAQAVSTPTLTTTTNFTCTNPDIRVEVYATTARGTQPADTTVPAIYWGREYTWWPTGGNPYIRLFDDSTANTVLHEFGHAFGLGDTYVEGGTGCKLYQPNSLMCAPGTFTALQPDDINGAHEAFCIANAPPVCRRQVRVTSTPLVGDFDSDGRRDDIAVWGYNEGVGYWSTKEATGSVTMLSLPWGMQSHIPLTGDFDGDGFWDDIATWSQFDGHWHARRIDGSIIFSGAIYGTEGDIPLAADFDNDGQHDLGIFRPSNGMWYARRASGQVIFAELFWGTQGDIPLVGDFDSDGQYDDLGIFRPSEGKWYAKRANNSVIFQAITWGQNGDVPMVGDFDGDTYQDDWIVYRPSEGKWYATRRPPQFEDGVPPAASRIFEGLGWGTSTDIPVVGDFDADNRFDDIAAYRPSEKNWYTRTKESTTIYIRYLDGYMPF